MRLSAIVLVLSIAAACHAAPVVRVIQDFEGDAPRLTDDATIVEADGNHVLRWAPDRAEPWFLNLDFSDTELNDWDRLEFRYRIDGASDVDWWGVKVMDFPLGDGLQVPYRIPREEIALGEWATASFDLHSVTDRWGDTPNETAQTIVLRASGVKGDATTFLVDDIRVVREALHISAEAGETVRDGNLWRRQFTITARSAAEQPMTVRFEPGACPEGVSLTLPEPIELAPGEQREARASIAASATLQPLSQVTATVVALSDDDDRVEEQVVVSAPLPDVEHPVLLMKREDLPRIRERIEALDWAGEAWQAVLRNADNWADREVELPDRGGQWSHWYSCTECGASLATVSPTEHVCKSCGAEYTGWPYDDVVVMRDHSRLSNAARDLGMAYAITEDARYAAKAREILLAYADAYLKYPMHNKRGEDAGGACHVAAQPLTEATWLIPMVQGFDCVFDALGEADRTAIADGLLLPAAELVRSYARSIHNIPCWENAAYGMVGISLGNDDLAAQAINGDFGFRNQIAQGIDDDGVWYEGSWGYHYYTMSALAPLAVAAEHVGIDLYSERYLSMFTAPVRMMGPTGTLPAFNDSSRTRAVGSGRARLYENACSHWQSDELAVVLATGNRSGYEALLYGPDEAPTGATLLTSTIFPAAGVAVLRADADERPAGLLDGVPASWLALDYGPHGSGHGHPDKLGFEACVAGKLFATDAGSVRYGNPAHGGWYKQTLSHNTVVVDGASQERTEGRLLFRAFDDTASLVAVESDGAYPGVVLRRFMALLPDGLLDLTVAISGEEHQYDWLLHGRGDLTFQQPMTPLDAPPGEGAYEWAEDWRSVARPDRENRLGVPPWNAEWAVDDELTIKLAHVVSSPDAELFTAIGRGNPATARDPFIMNRITGHTAAWATVAWWGSDETPELATLTSKGAPGAVTLDECGMHVRVGNREFVLVTAADGSADFGRIGLEGSGALIEFVDDRPVRCLAAHATRVTVGGVEVE